jgi:hypothetical protein
VPDTLDHAERDRSDDEYENQAHVLVPPLVSRKLAECVGNRKGRCRVNLGNPKEHLAAPPDLGVQCITLTPIWMANEKINDTRVDSPAGVHLVGLRRRGTLPERAGFGPIPKLPPPEGDIPSHGEDRQSRGLVGRSEIHCRPRLFRRRLCPLVIHAGFTVLPNGDALVAESNAPANSNATRYSRHCYGLGHAAGGWDVPSPNRITLLRDLDGNGIAETKSMFLKGLNSPLGMALVGDSLYVADTDALLRFPYRDGDTKIATPPENGRLAVARSTAIGRRT